MAASGWLMMGVKLSTPNMPRLDTVKVEPLYSSAPSWLARARSAKSLALADRASRLSRSASRITGTMSPASRATAMPRFTWARRMICSPSRLTRISG